jgi:nucleoside-diphosphate-sugar epimerase
LLASSDPSSSVVPSGSKVLVVGATGGVGQLVVAKLLEAGYIVRAAARNPQRADETFKGAVEKEPSLELVCCDLRDLNAVLSSNMAKDVDAVVSCVGTTAFPSRRWRDGNGPEPTDYVSTRNVVQAVTEQSSKTCKRVVFVSSVGVDRVNVMPFLVLNAFGALKNKKKGEDVVKRSGFPYTLLRPGRLTDGPYTSYDINTLLKATSGERRAVECEKGDALLPEETSRVAVADAVVASLASRGAVNGEYCLGTKAGDGPGDDAEKWDAIFKAANERA